MIKPPVSVILPVLNEEAKLQQQLSRLAELRAAAPDAFEVIVVDGGSEDNTFEIAQALADQAIRVERGRARQMNAGATAASGNVLVFLHVDVELPPQAIESWRRLWQSAEVWGFFPVILGHSGLAYRLIGWFMNQRSRLTRVATGDQVLCVKAEAFQRLDGYPPISLMEDIALSKSLRSLGRPVVFSCAVRCSVRKWQRHGVLRLTVLMWYLRAAYYFGADPDRLHQLYYPELRRVKSDECRAG